MEEVTGMAYYVCGFTCYVRKPLILVSYVVIISFISEDYNLVRKQNIN